MQYARSHILACSMFICLYFCEKEHRDVLDVSGRVAQNGRSVCLSDTDEAFTIHFNDLIVHLDSIHRVRHNSRTFHLL